MNQERYQARRLRKRMWITLIAALLALITVVLSALTGAFNFHKGLNTIPDLTGMTEEDAIAEVEKLHGNPSVSYKPSDKREGTVISQGLPAGSSVTPNSTVSIVVSSGKEEETAPFELKDRLPSFIGLSMDLAKVTAEELKVHIVEDGYVYDDSIPYGSIVEQDPEGGTEIVPGSAIRVKISAGPEIVRYTITVSAGQGGTISPDTVTVEEGEDISFTITPDDGYVISSLRVDGEEVQALNRYTFLSVDADHTISVTFDEGQKSGLEDLFEQIFGAH